MLLYLLRHADALDALDDDTRQLSPKGHRQIEALARFVGKVGAFRPQEIWHSPLIRARDTAYQLARALRLNARLCEVGGLRPESDPAIMAQLMRNAPDALAIVGHEPHMSAFASLLIAGQASPPVVVFDKCTLLALEGPVNHWAVRWHIPADLLG